MERHFCATASCSREDLVGKASLRAGGVVKIDSSVVRKVEFEGMVGGGGNDENPWAA